MRSYFKLSLIVSVSLALSILSLYFLPLSCDKLSFVEEPPGTITLSLSKEQIWEQLYYKSSSGYSSSSDQEKENWIEYFSYSLPDTNSFILSVKNSDGQVAYSGEWGERPIELKVAPGSWEVELLSINFNKPLFNTPQFGYTTTVVVESGKSVSLSLLCSMLNGAVRLTFSPQFLERFIGYNVEVEDINSIEQYPFNENRYLFLTPGTISLSLRSEFDYLPLARRVLRAAELITLNLHSSTSSNEQGQEPIEGSNIVWKLSIDSTVVAFNDEVVVGERRDGSSLERAILVDQLENFIGAKGVWITGFIAGTLKGSTINITPPFDVNTNLALSAVPGEGSRELCVGVALAQGELRSALNLLDNPYLLGEQVWIKGTVVESYYGLVGVNPITNFSLE